MVGDIRARRIDLAISRGGESNHGEIGVGDLKPGFVNCRAGEECDIIAVCLNAEGVLLENELIGLARGDLAVGGNDFALFVISSDLKLAGGVADLPLAVTVLFNRLSAKRREELHHRS